MSIKIFWQSPRFYMRPGLYLKLNNKRICLFAWG